MIVLPRLRPEPLPPVHPVPEYRADDALRARYADMKAVFQVPWMGVVTMAFAHYRGFYDQLWQGLRPLCVSRAFIETCQGLRRTVEGRIAALAPPPIAQRLSGLGYAPREIADIRAVIEIFSHGNFPYLLVATIARGLLEGGALSEATAAVPFAGRHAPDVEVPLVLMEAHHADPPTRALYEEVKATLRLPIVNTDYRALARWPSYFAAAWADLKPVVADPSYEALVAEIHALTLAAVNALPNPGALRAETLRRAAAAAPGEVLAVVRLFQWLLPGLVANVAFLRGQFLDRRDGPT
jgi:Halocarboxylic acid dehydrogenase DehI